MEPILEIKHITKKYNIKHRNAPSVTLSDSIKNIFKSRVEKEEFYVLSDVNLNIYPGESFGIIGRNGAGKSTLLKILSRITYPTSGKIISRGRIASLLEVGTGFHMELTGRENIYLNGALLGLKHREIKKKFGNIVDFSGVEKFLDTPLKHYSSGMQLRLAFSVAAHLDPDILIIDEVLAVGDAEFQKRCIGKMEETTKSGRTIIFVSHQLSSMDMLCRHAIVLHNGKLMFNGDTTEAINFYINNYTGMGEYEAKKNSPISEIGLYKDDQKVNIISTFDSVTLKFKLNIDYKINNLNVGLVFKNQFNNPVIGISNRNYGIDLTYNKTSTVEISFDSIPLVAGNYTVEVYIGDGISDHFVVENAYHFNIIEKNLFVNGKNPDPKINSFIIKNVNWYLY